MIQVVDPVHYVSMTVGGTSSYTTYVYYPDEADTTAKNLTLPYITNAAEESNLDAVNKLYRENYYHCGGWSTSESSQKGTRSGSIGARRARLTD